MTPLLETAQQPQPTDTLSLTYTPVSANENGESVPNSPLVKISEVIQASGNKLLHSPNVIDLNTPVPENESMKPASATDASGLAASSILEEQWQRAANPLAGVVQSIEWLLGFTKGGNKS